LQDKFGSYIGALLHYTKIKVMSFYIVETKEQLQELPLQEECYINVIPLSDNYHPILSEVSLY
jgi:hypothetical protein